MNKKANQRKPIFWVQIVGVLIGLVILLGIWLGWFVEYSNNRGDTLEITLGVKIIVTIVILFIFAVTYWQHNHQKKLDVGSGDGS